MASKIRVFSLALIFLFVSSCTRPFLREVSEHFNPPNFRFVKNAGGISEYILEKNGLRVLLMENHSAPVVTTMVTYLAGVRNENKNDVQVAHLLEHMVMKATAKYNRESGTAPWVALQSVGAMMNATTEADKTSYYETLPSGRLELALEIESDRMRNALLKPEDAAREIKVVESELERLANSPATILEDAVWRTAFRKHPYQFLANTYWRSRVKNLTAKNLRTFYDSYYWPNNAVLTVIGDFDTKNLLPLIDQEFGRLSKSPAPIPIVHIEESGQKKARGVRIVTEDKIESVLIAHKIPPAAHSDIFALEILSCVLANGAESRLYKRVVEPRIATGVSSEVSSLFDSGLFTLTASPPPNVRHGEVARAILAVYEDIKKNGVTQEEVERAKNQLKVKTVFERDGSYSIAGKMSEAIGSGDWTLFPTFMGKINRVTANDVKKAAQLYLVPGKMTVGYLVSKKITKHHSKKETNVPENSSKKESKLQSVRENHPLTVAALGPSGGQWADGKEQSFSERAIVKMVNGIKVICVRTAVKDIVTIAGSFEGPGRAFSGNPAAAEMTASLLGTKTKKHTKYEIANLLENRGINISFGIDYKHLNIQARSMREHLPLAVQFIAEELREPVFDSEEFEKIKEDTVIGIKEKMTDPLQAGYSEFKRLIYAPNHPNYEIPFEKQLEMFQRITVGEARSFYESNYIFKHFIMVFVGDITSEEAEEMVRESFDALRVRDIPGKYTGSVSFIEPQRKKIQLKGKNNIEVFMGHVVPLNPKNKDYPALYLANFVLGGDFSARLLTKIREELGLTYHIHSQFGGMSDDLEGHWVINLMSGKAALEKAIQETQNQIALFAQKGITAEELERKKGTIIGSFQMESETTSGLANQILRYEELKLGLGYIDEFPKRVNMLTLEEVNEAVRRYFHSDKLIIVAAGDLD